MANASAVPSAYQPQHRGRGRGVYTSLGSGQQRLGFLYGTVEQRGLAAVRRGQHRKCSWEFLHFGTCQEYQVAIIRGSGLISLGSSKSSKCGWEGWHSYVCGVGVCVVCSIDVWYHQLACVYSGFVQAATDF